ncbi:MAG: hypothetical protein A2Z18_10145 [Armatimonadetes bacterium RBG_16_58_9]|nr:MAG: hypothetical protein A2Z18_10145 [Armatimonadetes bacterium RBG_16_58_9]
MTDKEVCMAVTKARHGELWAEEILSNRLACSTVTWGRNPDVLQMLSEIKDAGYAGVEFQQPIEWLGDATALKSMVDGMGLEIAAFYHGSALLTNDTAELDEHRRAIDYAASLGTRVYMIAGGWISGRSAEENDYQVLARNLDTLGKYASDQGLLLSFHPHMGSIVENLDQVDILLGLTDGFSLCPDTAHLVAAGSDPVQTILRHGDRTTHFHLKDYKRPSDGVYSGRCFVELGEGDAGLDFPAIFSALDQVGYHEWLVVELDYTRTSAFTSAAQSMQYLMGLLGQQ